MDSLKAMTIVAVLCAGIFEIKFGVHAFKGPAAATDRLPLIYLHGDNYDIGHQVVCLSVYMRACV